MMHRAIYCLRSCFGFGLVLMQLVAIDALDLRAAEPQVTSESQTPSDGAVNSSSAPKDEAQKDREFFEQRIRPLLREHCYECHSSGADSVKGGFLLDDQTSAMRGGDAGVALVPGKPDESRLIEAVRWTNEDLQMPPAGSLKPEEIAILAEWVQRGVPWSAAEATDAVGGTKPFVISDAARSHWSFQPVQRPHLPTGKNPIDWLVSQRLAEQSITPNGPASSAVLLRRVYFDLIGLPPSPENVAAFEADPSPVRYGQIVEDLLASPRYGERWGRHWLDIVRFTETQGFEYDRVRDHAWPYRDYVIRSFNEDLPYDLFMRQQIAGDVLEPISPSSIVATSMLVCGPYDQAGNAQANLTQRAITREEELEDLLSVVGQTFLGLTVNCARCHNHKFDPISQSDYYRMKAVFDGVKHGDRSIEATASSNTSSAGTEEGGSGEPQTFIAYCGTRIEPAPTHVLRRGDVKSPAEQVTAGGPTVLASSGSEFDLQTDAPEAIRRARFAGWLTDPRNPLPARVMVNRIWQYHFGQGLVTTPSDLGASGAKPSHPELLDWLAAEFVANGWSVKSVHRWIVHSATYKQSAGFNPEAAAKDADNQLLWRYPPRRLEAEVLRDAMLSVSGQLNLQMGGPSFRPFTTTDFNATFYHPFDRGDAEFNRRTVYRMNVNSGKDPMLDVFDCPDPSIKTPKRNVTTTPLQALSLMNGSFVQRQAEHLADRSMQEAEGDVSRAIGRAYLWTLAREPNAEERQRAKKHAEANGLKSVCWALLNSTEFLYVQ